MLFFLDCKIFVFYMTLFGKIIFQWICLFPRPLYAREPLLLSLAFNLCSWLLFLLTSSGFLKGHTGSPNALLPDLSHPFQCWRPQYFYLKISLNFTRPEFFNLGTTGTLDQYRSFLNHRRVFSNIPGPSLLYSSSIPLVMMSKCFQTLLNIPWGKNCPTGLRTSELEVNWKHHEDN